MPDREHTDPKALDAFYKLTSAPSSRPRWYRVVWRWIKEELFKEPFEPRSEDAAVLRRIRVHELATGGARRLRKLPRDEAADILVVTAMLLGFDGVTGITRRTREARR